ncbi:polyprenyl synthetase family protein [Candidatus Woesearchaeota archaeon]|nr:polyprenyl synthetase family protein [Candidatus Woesearchaeota archaeon]
MKGYFNKVVPLIEAEINRFLPVDASDSWVRYIAGGYGLDKSIVSRAFSEPFHELFGRGGKRLRPVLACLTHDALDGSCPVIYRLAAIPELMHTGSLIIDDIEDRSSLRRGKRAIHEMYGTALSINHGNFLYFYPMLAIRDCGLAVQVREKLYEVVAEESVRLHVGQGADIYWSGNRSYDVSVGDYLQMCALKSGSMVSLSMKIGAIAADAQDDVLVKLGSIAGSLGVAFQVRDDVLNLSSSRGLGKDFGEDITEGKLTYPVIHALSSASASGRASLLKILAAGTKDASRIRDAVSIMEDCGAFAAADRLSRGLIRDAKSVAGEVFHDSEFRGVLMQVLDYSVEREN